VPGCLGRKGGVIAEKEASRTERERGRVLGKSFPLRGRKGEGIRLWLRGGRDEGGSSITQEIKEMGCAMLANDVNQLERSIVPIRDGLKVHFTEKSGQTLWKGRGGGELATSRL